VGGLTDQAGGDVVSGKDQIARAREAWQESMSRRIDEVRGEVSQRNLNHLVYCSGAELDGSALRFPYWGREVSISWPDLEATYLPEHASCPTFDEGMLLYYLHTADGVALADRWIGFRELPDGAFYNQAFQGYSGDLIAKRYGGDLETFHQAAQKMEGFQLRALAPAAYSFSPLPRIRLALAMWPGDEDFSSRASVLFDANASHYMTTDGLALLGSGLARRLIRAGLSV
jgi:hypothetical protein